MTTAALNLKSGEPLWQQRWKIHRAAKRNKLLRILRCKLGKHNPPADQIFEEYGAVMVGGACTECDDSIWREVTWIGNAWDFEGTTDRDGNAFTIHPNRLLKAAHAHVHQLLSK